MVLWLAVMQEEGPVGSVPAEVPFAEVELAGGGGGGDAAAVGVDAAAELAIKAAALLNEIHLLPWTALIYSPIMFSVPSGLVHPLHHPERCLVHH